MIVYCYIYIYMHWSYMAYISTLDFYRLLLIASLQRVSRQRIDGRDDASRAPPRRPQDVFRLLLISKQ